MAGMLVMSGRRSKASAAAALGRSGARPRPPRGAVRGTPRTGVVMTAALDAQVFEIALDGWDAGHVRASLEGIRGRRARPLRSKAAAPSGGCPRYPADGGRHDCGARRAGV